MAKRPSNRILLIQVSRGLSPLTNHHHHRALCLFSAAVRGLGSDLPRILINMQVVSIGFWPTIYLLCILIFADRLSLPLLH